MQSLKHRNMPFVVSESTHYLWILWFSDSIHVLGRLKLATENVWGIDIGITINHIPFYRLDLLMLRSGRATLLNRAVMESKS
jgi:hypothetical protein